MAGAIGHFNHIIRKISIDFHRCPQVPPIIPPVERDSLAAMERLSVVVLLGLAASVDVNESSDSAVDGSTSTAAVDAFFLKQPLSVS